MTRIAGPGREDGGARPVGQRHNAGKENLAYGGPAAEHIGHASGHTWTAAHKVMGSSRSSSEIGGCQFPPVPYLLRFDLLERFHNTPYP